MLSSVLKLKNSTVQCAYLMYYTGINKGIYATKYLFFQSFEPSLYKVEGNKVQLIIKGLHFLTGCYSIENEVSPR